MCDAEKALDEFCKYCNGKIEIKTDESPGKHGKIIDTHFEAFHDVTVYEDGYEERFYIGD